MANGQPWQFEKILQTPFYDILATLRLQKQLGHIAEKAEEYMHEDMKNRNK